jgi:hypothetical protein
LHQRLCGIEQVLEVLPGLSLEEVRQRVRDSVETFRSDYTGFEGDEAEFSSLLDKIGQAGSIAEFYDLLQPDTFEPY